MKCQKLFKSFQNVLVAYKYGYGTIFLGNN